MNGNHNPALRELRHEVAAGGHKSGGVFKGQHARNVKSCELADGVPHQESRAHPVSLECSGAGDLMSENRRLRTIRVMQHIARRHRVTQVEGHVVPQHSNGLVESFAESPEVHQAGAHAGALRALAAEHPGQPAGTRFARDQPEVVVSLQSRSRGLPQVVGVLGEQDRAPLPNRVPGKRPGCRMQRRIVLQPRELLKPGTMTTCCAARCHHGDRHRGRRHLFRLALRQRPRGRIADEDMHIGAADAE